MPTDVRRVPLRWEHSTGGKTVTGPNRLSHSWRRKCTSKIISWSGYELLPLSMYSQYLYLLFVFKLNKVAWLVQICVEWVSSSLFYRVNIYSNARVLEASVEKLIFGISCEWKKCIGWSLQTQISQLIVCLFGILPERHVSLESKREASAKSALCSVFLRGVTTRQLKNNVPKILSVSYCQIAQIILLKNYITVSAVIKR